jgi:hypothetical protein
MIRDHTGLAEHHRWRLTSEMRADYESRMEVALGMKSSAANQFSAIVRRMSDEELKVAQVELMSVVFERGGR